jgi:ATP-dependent DNA helicase RecG
VSIQDQQVEGQHFDRKSLRIISRDHGDFPELARDCVCFANSAGGQLVIGVEDEATEPPPGQRIDKNQVDRVRKRIGELTVNVEVHPELRHHANGGDYLLLTVSRSLGVASTTDGRYFLRIGDACLPIVGDDVLRLANERPTTPWETLTTLAVPRSATDPAKLAALVKRIRASDRVKPSVREKSADEILVHYGLAHGPVLTNLGILLIGTRVDRTRLGTAPVIQAIKVDERGTKINKLVWDDYTLSPLELVDAVWAAVPDFRESYELPDGLSRTTVPAFEEAVVRELLVNSLVHRPYTQRGDIFLNLRPDELEIVNPGRLPLGVTPKNILHASRRRNDGLARIFHDIGLMEREGSGFDLMYDRLLATGRGTPVATEGVDSVHITIPRRVIHPAIIRLIADADKSFQLTQRERIALGLLAQSESLSAGELASKLELSDPGALREWVARMLEIGLVERSGRTKATRYSVPSKLLRSAGVDIRTTLARVLPHRLRALILEDLERFPESSAPEIHQRVGREIPPRSFRRSLEELVAAGQVLATGERRWRRYRVSASIGQEKDRGR